MENFSILLEKLHAWNCNLAFYSSTWRPIFSRSAQSIENLISRETISRAFVHSFVSSILRKILISNETLFFAGFLNTNSEPYQKARVANYGLMDQIAALHWIQQNIGHFGGDSKNITLMGHGTGAACINFLMISPAVMPGNAEFFQFFISIILPFLVI